MHPPIRGGTREASPLCLKEEKGTAYNAVCGRAEATVMYPCECRGSHDASPLQRQPRCIPTEWWSRDASLRTRGRASLCRRLGQ